MSVWKMGNGAKQGFLLTTEMRGVWLEVTERFKATEPVKMRKGMPLSGRRTQKKRWRCTGEWNLTDKQKKKGGLHQDLQDKKSHIVIISVISMFLEISGIGKLEVNYYLERWQAFALSSIGYATIIHQFCIIFLVFHTEMAVERFLASWWINSLSIL